MTTGSEAAELVAFLHAQLDADENRAKACPPWPWAANAEGDEVVAADGITVCDGFALSNNQLRATVDHIVGWDPARVLAEVESKRKILDEHGPETVWDGLGTEETVCTTCRYDDGTGTFPYGGCPTVRALAAPYAGRPDFPAERKP